MYRNKILVDNILIQSVAILEFIFKKNAVCIRYSSIMLLPVGERIFTIYLEVINVIN